MRRENVGHGWGGSASASGLSAGLTPDPGTPHGRSALLLDRCLSALAEARAAEARLLDAVMALRSELDDQLFGNGETSLWGATSQCRSADVDAATVDELVTASGMSRLYTGGLVRLAGAPPARRARGREAVTDEQVELRRVIDWHEATEHLREDDALAVGDSVFSPRKDGAPRTASEFRRLLTKRVRQVEAEDREARRRGIEEALRQRGSWSSPGQDGTGALTVTGEATRVAAAHARLDAAARRAKAAGDQRTLSQLRSDLHLDLLLVGQLPGPATPLPLDTAGTPRPAKTTDSSASPDSSDTPALPVPSATPAPTAPPVCTSCGTVSNDYLPFPTVGDPVLPPARCTVVVGLDLLLDGARERPPGPAPSRPPDESPPTAGPRGGTRGVALGWMPGFGYLDPDHVRRVAVREGSVWRRLVADPLTGHALNVSPFTYRPTASVARFVRARDGVARDPGSGSFGATAAEDCEIDHVEPFEAGGATTPENLQALSRRGHARKTKRQWRVEGDANGELTWTSATGRRYRSEPLDYRDA